MKKIKLNILYKFVVIFATFLSICTNAYAAGDNAVIKGKGTNGSCYVLDFSNAMNVQGGTGKYIEIELKKGQTDFWFQLSDSSKRGTYSVEYDSETRKVKITYLNNNNRIYYPKNQNDPYYAQAGAVAIADGNAAELERKDTKFAIETQESGTYFWSYAISKGGVGKKNTTYQLKNTFVPGGEIYVPSEIHFVFTPGGTVEELYEAASKEICNGSIYNYIRTDEDGYKEYVIDPRTPTWALLSKEEEREYNVNNFPTTVVRVEEKSGKDTELIVKYHFKTNEIVPEEKAGVIEFAITKILLILGMVFMLITKAFLGQNLTMDAIIFNKYDMTIIDFRGKIGIFANEEVNRIINTLYSGFEKVAIVINIVILLYLGIQIVLNVGGEKQSKYFKNLENWVVGILILFLAPTFFPFITDISNAIVGFVGSSVTPYVTQYTISTILDDDSILGEDADTVDIKAKVEQGIAQKKEEQEGVLEDINEYNEIALEKYNSLQTFNQKQQEWINKLESSGNYTPEKIQELRVNSDFMGHIDAIKNYIELNRVGWSVSNEADFLDMIDAFDKRWKVYEEAIYYRPNCSEPPCDLYIQLQVGYMEQHSPECEMSRVYPIKEARKFIEEYKELQLNCGSIENDIGILESYDSSKDLMGEMRVKAGETGRVVYAIIWFVLFFQLITLLGLYYKRIIMVAILIMIFPIVMVTYAIDKIGDGSAQTFSTWTKEFMLNIVVQIAHAVIYVTLIDTGIQFYQANPKNWLFFIIAVLCLFPMERTLRSMFGMQGSTIGNLKANVVAGIAAARGAYNITKKAGNLASRGVNSAKMLGSDIKRNGVGSAVGSRFKTLGNNIKNSWNDIGKKEAEANEKRAKKRQAVADRRKRTRDSNIQLRRQKMQNASGVKKAWLKTLNAASMVRNGMYHAGNVGRKIKGLSRTAVGRNAGKVFKLAGMSAQKVAGLSAMAITGATNAVSQAGQNGALAGAMYSANVAKQMGSVINPPKKQQSGSATQNKKPNTPQPHTNQNMPGGSMHRTPASVARQQQNGQRSVASAANATKQRIRGTKKTVKQTVKVNRKNNGSSGNGN